MAEYRITSPDDREAGASILNLSPEILDAICGMLCLHCSHVNAVDVPYSLIHAATRDQRALSSLSRTCSRLRDRAQPVLFHTCYSKLLSPGFAVDEFIGATQTNLDLHSSRKLASYLRHISNEICRTYLLLRTFLERGDLKSCVRSLSFYHFPWDRRITLDRRAIAILETSRKHHAKLAVQVVGHPWAILRAILGEPEDELTTTTTMGTRAEQQFSHLYYVQELVIAFCATSLRQLCIERDTSDESMITLGHPDWHAWVFNFPNLTHLAFPGRRNPHEISNYQESISFISRAPNLRVLTAPDCPALLLQKSTSRYLTKLSVNDISYRALRNILRECPVLQDLEFHRACRNEENLLSPEEDLASVKGTLRRLCYSALGENNEYGINELDMHVGRIYPSWSCLPALEVFETERMLLYRSRDETTIQDIEREWASIEQSITRNLGLVRKRRLQSIERLHRIKMGGTVPEDFLSRLPPAVKTLRIGNVWSWDAMYRDALALAEKAPTRFPHLRELRLEVITEACVPPMGSFIQHRVLPEKETQNLVRVFSTVGVVCSIKSVGRDTRGLSRGVLPLRPGQLGFERWEARTAENGDRNDSENGGDWDGSDWDDSDWDDSDNGDSEQDGQN